MSARFSRTLVFRSPQATADFARLLAPVLGAGDTILLDGPIGAGKTHFARALIQARLSAAGRLEDVPSPTYTLVQTYDDGADEIWHADLYRLSGPDDVEELGLSDAFETAICLVEWPDRLGGLALPGALTVSLAQGDEPGVRTALLSSDDSRWAVLVDQAGAA